jgi:hypothetical protein
LLDWAEKVPKIINGHGVIDACAPAPEISIITRDQSRAEAAAAASQPEASRASTISHLLKNYETPAE